MSGLLIATTWEDDLCHIALGGEARLETIQPFEAVANEINERGVSAVMIDMAGLQFMDSASTGALIRLRGDIGKADGSLVLYSVPRLIRRLLEHLGLKQFTVVEDEAAARERLA